MKTNDELEIQAYIAETVREMLDGGQPRAEEKRGGARAILTAAALAVLTAALAALIVLRFFTPEATAAAGITLPEPVYTCVTLAAAPEPEPPAADELEEIYAVSALSSRYAPVTAPEFELMARVVYAESNTESLDGQQAVAEVILNRRAAGNFSDTIEGVIYAPNQFSTAPMLDAVTPTQTNYAAVWLALYGEPILPLDVVYFSRGAENANVWGRIGAHVFCYQYVWG